MKRNTYTYTYISEYIYSKPDQPKKEKTIRKRECNKFKNIRKSLETKL